MKVSYANFVWEAANQEHTEEAAIRHKKRDSGKTKMSGSGS